MYKNFSITEQEKKQILEIHISNGYKTQINEQVQNGSVVEKLDDMNNKNLFIKKGKLFFKNRLFVLNFLSQNPVSEKNVAVMYNIGSDKIEIQDGKSFKKTIQVNEIDTLPDIINPLLKSQ
jgi:hypothetical protein